MNIYIILNILVVIIYLFALVSAYKKGFIYEIVSLLYTGLVFVAAWFFSPIFANLFTLIHLQEPYSLLGIEPIVNTIVYFAIIVIVLKLLGLFIMPIFKSLTKIPLVGAFNKFLGLFLGFFNASVIVIAISIILSTPLISNGKEIKENTVFKYVDDISKKVTEIIVDNIDFNKLKLEIENIDVEKLREDFKVWLIAQGIVE